MKIRRTKGVRQIIIPVVSWSDGETVAPIPSKGVRPQWYARTSVSLDKLAPSTSSGENVVTGANSPRHEELERKIAGLERKLEQRADYDQKIAALEKQLATLQATVDKFGDKLGGFGALEKKLGVLETHVAALQTATNEQGDCRGKLLELQAQLATLQVTASKFDTLEKKLGVLETHVAALQTATNEQGDCRKKLQEFEAQIATLQATANKYGVCEEKLAALEKKFSEKSDDCATCKQTVDEQRKIIEALLERMQKLETASVVASPPEVPSASPTPATPSRIVVSYIDFVGTEKTTQGDEFIEIKNMGETPQDVTGWRVDAGHAGQEFKFAPGSILQPGAAMRIYTNRPDGLSFGSKTALWNDAGDFGRLLDASGKVVSEYGYGTKETRTVAGIKAIYGVANLQVIYDPGQVAKQKRKSDRMDFLSAVERALRCLLYDSATLNLPAGPPKDASPEACERFVRDHLDKNALRVLSEDSPEKSELKLSSKDHWIFLLDKGFGAFHWVIVDRHGNNPARQEIL